MHGRGEMTRMHEIDQVEYTPPALAFPVQEGLVRACRETFGTLRAVVLTGSLARNEASYVCRAGRAILQSDVEAMVVLQDDAALPTRATHQALCHLAQHYLQERGVAVEVSFSVVHAAYLRHLPPHIYSYELRCCGVVLFGDSDVLHLIPSYSASELSREDAWRMLGNRLIERMAADSADAAMARYRGIKLCLDLASSLLVFFGRFQAGYRARLYCMEEAAATAQANALPFDLRQFMPLLRQCTAAKLDSETAVDLGPDFEERVTRWAWQLWQWELASISGCSASFTAEQMLRAFGRRQGGRKLLRGWAYTVRRVGWLRSVRHWFKWLAICVGGLTPRHAIYLAAHHWHACEANGSVDAARELAGVRKLLPVCRAAQNSPALLAAEIVRNYKEFAVETRA